MKILLAVYSQSPWKNVGVGVEPFAGTNGSSFFFLFIFENEIFYFTFLSFQVEMFGCFVSSLS